jgi:hypothetical protein
MNIGTNLARRRVSALVVMLIGSLIAGCDRSKPNVIPPSATAYLDAQKSFEAGENDRALELVSASLEQEPSSWGHFLRAQIYVKLGDEAKAMADCDAGLQLVPGDAKLSWLKGELAKPAAARFQGQFKDPPSVDR